MKNINEIIHAWERKALPDDLEGLEETLATVNAHDQEARKWEAESVSVPVKSYYNFDMGLCAHMRADLERLIEAEKLDPETDQKPDRNVILMNQDFTQKSE